MSTPRVPATRLLHQPSGVSTQEPLQPSPRRVSGIRRIRLETSHGRQSELPTSSALITYCTQGNSQQVRSRTMTLYRHRWSPKRRSGASLLPQIRLWLSPPLPPPSADSTPYSRVAAL